MGRTRCALCGRGPVVAHQISHSHKVSRRRQRPNLHRVRVPREGIVSALYVCTRCLRSGRVQKAS